MNDTSIGSAEFEYVTGQARPSFPALLAGFEAQSAAAAKAASVELDLRYGPAPRETFDLFRAATDQPRGTLVYFHAGYWQSRDKSTFRFIAPAFTRLGLNVALVNYPLCPTVTLAELIGSARASLDAVANVSTTHGRALPLVLSGHSAGGHLAVELALALVSDASAASVSPGPTLAGVIALSGIYDLAPLVATTLNRNLKLDAADAVRHSPLHRARRGCVNALFGVGGDETAAFVAQSRHMCEAWQQAGNPATLDIAPSADHFSLLQEFTSPSAPLHRRVVAFLDEVLSAR
ncbi:alpha/beta hydrolase [Paraburkholderia antibiotica]|uniref:Alpha/beta hydrolase n=1 Tax=Paraburkholderia antibiotica TaxID=2728839 RepID=A0A7X9X5M1_9BURK|nr:alpha/beta hydrolase [Paraburkholderia antibiotica]NML31865.1 alpha/beta hydrolase [Paraburkholderia antibiotica]